MKKLSNSILSKVLGGAKQRVDADAVSSKCPCNKKKKNKNRTENAYRDVLV